MNVWCRSGNKSEGNNCTPQKEERGTVQTLLGLGWDEKKVQEVVCVMEVGWQRLQQPGIALCPEYSAALGTTDRNCRKLQRLLKKTKLSHGLLHVGCL